MTNVNPARKRIKKRALTAKQKTFAQEFVKTKNATESALRTYDTTDRVVAGSIGSENLQKPQIRQEILHLMRQNDIELDDVLNIHKRNMLQDEHLPTSQKAVSDFYDILGIKEAKANTSVQVAFIIEQ